MYRILIVEDDAGIAEAVSEQAKMWNFETHSVTNFRDVMAEFAEFDPHLVLICLLYTSPSPRDCS